MADAQRPSRVVYSRVALDVIVGCFDMLELVAKINTETLPASTVLSQTLEAFINSAKRGGQIPIRSREEVEARINKIFDSPNEIAFPVPDTSDFALPAPGEGEEEEKEPTLDGYDSALRDAKRNMAQPTVDTTNLEVNQNVAPPPKKPKPDFSTAKRLSIDFIRSQSPKDRLLEWADETGDNKALDALCIIYAQLPADYWGSEKAERMVLSIYTQMVDDG